MSAPICGVPAFPGARWVESESLLQRNPVFEPGMTVRDYFAAHATDGDIEAYKIGPVTKQIESVNGSQWREVTAPLRRTRAQAKYAYADEMINARSA